MRAATTVANRLRGCCGVVLLCGCSLVPAGCHKKEAVPEAKPAVSPGEVRVAPELAGQIKLGHMTEHAIAGTLQVAARVEADQRHLANVGSPVGGRITRLLAFESQPVRAGEALAMLHSNDLSDAQFSFVRATTQDGLARQAMERANQLLAADVIGRAELERRRAELLQTDAEVDSIRTQLRGLGMSAGTIERLERDRKLTADYPVLASVSGTVLKRSVTVGQIVTPGEETFQIADLSSVWIVADVPESDAAQLARGMEVLFAVPALAQKASRGTLTYVSPVVNPVTRTIQVRLDVANPQRVYKPDMLAQMQFTGRAENKPVVPETAVVRQENEDFVFVRTGENRFVLRRVALGEEYDDMRVVISGITADETIVVDGAFHLNNKRRADAIRGGD